MSSEMAFQGEFTFGSAQAVAAVLAEVGELLAEDDEELSASFAGGAFLQPQGAAVRVDISVEGPSEWWFSLESIVETLSESAATGHVDGTSDQADGSTRYLAGGEQEEID